MGLSVYTDISIYRGWVRDDEMGRVPFGWAAVSVEDGYLTQVKLGTGSQTDFSSIKAEGWALARARKLYPTATLYSDCKHAIGWDERAVNGDPFLGIAHHACRAALYHRLVRAGYAMKGKRKIARRKLRYLIELLSLGPILTVHPQSS